jgi:CubicO group peptidase (beta-lactamase class C family)
MSIISRRTCLQQLALATAAPLFMPRLAAAAELPELDAAETSAIGKIARDFMAKHQVPGLSVAFSRFGQPVFQAAYGMADEASGEDLATDHLFRIASVSKPLTAVAVFTLIEAGKLKIDDKVLGPDGILTVGRDIKLAADVRDITIHHLLTHTCGGWQNDGNDPMFRHPELDHADLIARTLRDQPLKNAPGMSYAYSNFGYCLLGRVIEKLSGKPYADYVRKAILNPCGIERMKISGNTLAERAPGEVVYYGRDGEDPYQMNVRRMDSHGGWLASPAEFVKFLVRCDGSQRPSDLLRQTAFKTMMTATKANAGYACGWSVNGAPNRWHGGSLPGTATIAVQTASGMCWAGFTNSRGKDIGGALDNLMWHIARAVPAWKA